MNARERLHRARTLVGEGHFDEALAEYVWFHHNALAEDPSLRGVRRAFALGYCRTRGEVSPGTPSAH